MAKIVQINHPWLLDIVNSDTTFCSSCRMPEVHKCPNLDKLKERKNR